MTVIAGQLVTPPQGAIVTPALSPALQGFLVDYWPTHAAIIGGAPQGTPTTHFPGAGASRAIVGQRVGSYLLDYYYRVHLTPLSIALGNLVSAQQRPVRVWNAWPSRSVTVTEVQADPDSGITLSGQADPPLDLMPLQELTWQINIANTGAASIDTRVNWVFAADPTLSLHITGQRVTAWTFTPNWNNGITERLEWMTLLERGSNGNETSTALREYPRRSWEFQPLVTGVERQRMEAMLYDASSRTWAVPVWPDKNVLAADLALGVLSIPVDTAGQDFHAGGIAILRSNAATYEAVEVDSVSSGAIKLVRATLNAWPEGTVLYPARTARLDDYPTLNRYTTRLVDSTVRFVAMDASDCDPAWPATTYLGTPVLETRPEWSNNPTTQYMRDVEVIDNDTGVVLMDDVSNLPWPIQSHRWQVYGRADRYALRQLLYAFTGKVNRVWLPTWQDDLFPVADASSTLLDVAACGYTAYLHGANGRRDIRVELTDGTVLYRRITASEERSDTVERLQVDTAWPSTIAMDDIRSISFMGLARLDTDAVEILHWNDSEGAAACAVTFAQVTGNG